MNVAELEPHVAVEVALTILLEKGFQSQYYTDWKACVEEEYDEDPEDYEHYSLVERQGVWQAFLEYVEKGKSFTSDNLTAKFVATHSDGEAVDTSDSFVILSLSDGITTRYFKRQGWYNSYSGDNLQEGEDNEVFPQEKTITVWRS